MPQQTKQQEVDAKRQGQTGTARRIASARRRAASATDVAKEQADKGTLARAAKAGRKAAKSKLKPGYEWVTIKRGSVTMKVQRKKKAS